jgi:alkanesulfonate monooxygenase SsuD/methylene tetrahydromethanopterin reductase-like flavin-dependent oxidoreductase (luciferase family)
MTTGRPIGVALGTVGASAAWWIESAERLEAAGYRDVWAWDHLMGQGDPSVAVLEQWTLLAAVAASTHRIGLGTWITNVNLRHPSVLARMATTLQEVSGGRLSLGLGVGGFAREHAVFGVPFPDLPERAARLESTVRVLRALWSDAPATLEDPIAPLRGAIARPVPRPAPPILLGAQSPAGVRRAARLGDGWAAETPAFEPLLPVYLEALAAAGKPRASQRIVLGFGGGKTGRDELAGSPWVEDQDAELARWLAKGVDAVVVTARTTADVDALVEAAEGS